VRGHSRKEGLVVLQLRPNCECCNVDLPPQSDAARICSFECTFCASCAESVLGGRCPNCGGELVARPRRPAAKLIAHPASTERVFKPTECSGLPAAH
jgi:hypothetical protein